MNKLTNKPSQMTICAKLLLMDLIATEVNNTLYYLGERLSGTTNKEITALLLEHQKKINKTIHLSISFSLMSDVDIFEGEQSAFFTETKRTLWNMLVEETNDDVEADFANDLNEELDLLQGKIVGIALAMNTINKLDKE